MISHVFRALLLLSFALPLFSQSLTGDILGTVFDPTGAVIAKANVQVTSLGQGWTRETQSDEYGNYIVSKVPPGQYKITITLAGFRTQVVPSVTIQVDQRARVDATLQPGEVSQEITVEAGSVPLLATDSNAIGQVMDTRTIRTLPLNGRRFFDLALLTAGAAPQGSTFSSVVWGRSTGVSLAGTRDINVGFLLDGSETRDERYGGTFQFSSVESIREFKVQQNFVDAQYGQAVGLVTAVTQNGTNQVHGSLYEFIRNNAFDARNFFDRTPGPPPFRFNQFGGSLGGPIFLPKYKGRDKSWFFVNYEGQRRRRATTRFATVPTERMRGGDLSELLPGTQIYDPLSGDAATGRRTPFPNNVIPTNRINRVSRNLLPYWPTPNLPGIGNNYVTTATDLDNYNQVTTRIDHNLTSKDRLMGRYAYIDQPTLRGDYAPLAGRVAPLRNNNAMVQYTRIVSPRAVNEFRFSYARSAASFSQEPVSENLGAQIGLKNVSTDPKEFGLPSVSVAGWSGFGSFSPTINNITDRFQWADDFTITAGKHNLKMGVDLRRVRYRQRSAQDPRGFIQYQANFSNPGPGIGGGSALADYLIGVPGFWQVQLEELGFDGRSTQPGLYFQDDFKVTRRLSLTLGVRWEYNSPWTQPRNNMAVFNFQTRKLEYALKDPFAFRTSKELGDVVSRSIINPQYNNWADRIGLVYRITEKTVFRAGHGYYWNNVNNNQLTQSMSLFYPFVYNPQQTESSSQLVPTRFVDALYDERPTGRDLPSGPSFSFFTVQKTYRRPYTGQWHANVQRTLGQNYLIEIGYLGNLSMKLPSTANFNQARLPDPNIPFQNQPLQSRRPYPEYGTIRQFDRMGKANYHGLTAKFERRFSGGFSYLASYTWSKAIDSGTDISSDPVKAPGDANSYRGLATMDTGHRFVGSWSYQLPFGKGKRYMNGGGVADYILGNWQWNGIATYQLGAPISVTAPATIPDVDAFQVYADRLCDGRLDRGARTRLRWFDTSCFALPRPGTFGNAGRSILRAPGIANWDMSLFKIFPLPGEGRDIQFRFETFNSFNHTQFGAPASGLPNPSTVFGVITSARDPRQIQLALRLGF